MPVDQGHNDSQLDCGPHQEEAPVAPGPDQGPAQHPGLHILLLHQHLLVSSIHQHTAALAVYDTELSLALLPDSSSWFGSGPSWFCTVRGIPLRNQLLPSKPTA